MEVRITTRRATVGESFLKAAEARIQKLSKFEPRLARVGLVLDRDREEWTAELRADVPGTPLAVAAATSDNQRSAFDRALDRLRRQLRRARSRRVEHQAAPALPVVED
jgi:ribosomal subunit interface protein